MIRSLQTSVGLYTDRFFSRRRIEQAAGRSLADAAADVGETLIQIRAELPEEAAWLDWVAAQGERARAEGLEVLDDRRAREHMALARFRTRLGERFTRFLKMSPACLFPILGLEDPELAILLAKGVTTRSGAAAPLEGATRDEVRAAVATLKGGPVPAKATPTRAEQFQLLLKQIEALGALTDAEKKELAERAKIDVDPPGEVATSDESGAAAPVPTYRGLLGPVTLQGGRPVLGTLDRTALADDAIASIREATSKCAMVKNVGTGALAGGRKTTAKGAAEALRLTVLGWPAWG